MYSCACRYGGDVISKSTFSSKSSREASTPERILDFTLFGERLSNSKSFRLRSSANSKTRSKKMRLQSWERSESTLAFEKADFESFCRCPSLYESIRVALSKGISNRRWSCVSELLPAPSFRDSSRE